MARFLLESERGKRIRLKPLREESAMTVGVGFQCLDGVVLCADRQITKGGDLKYGERYVKRILQGRV